MQQEDDRRAGGAQAAPAAGPGRKPSEVIYQIYPSSFADSNGDGQGDLAGIAQRLGYVAALGVDAVWISPFYPSPPGPEGDGGYAVTDYRAVDPKFGTMDDFKKLLAEAHRQGLRVYIDFVLAHTALGHEWFGKSVAREKGFEDRYVWHDGWKDGSGNRYPPNNWKSVFGGPAWEFSEERGQWYLHHFLKSQPALNLNRADVQDAILDEMKFWLDLGVDGFRLDALPFCNYDPQFRHNPWRDGKWPRPTENWDEQYFAHSICQPQTVDLVRRIRALLDTYPGGRKALGEAIAGPDGGTNSIPVAASYVAGKGLDMCYTEALMGVHEYPSAARMREMVGQIEHHFSEGGNCNAASNHDMARSATRLTANLPEADRAAAARQLMKLFLTMPGSFCMYQGEELGLPQARIPQDIPLAKLRDAVAFTRGVAHSRDGSRTPMPWRKGALQAAFTTSSADPYLPIPAAHYPLAADAQESDPGSMLNETRRLLAWRKAQPALIDGSAQALPLADPALGILRENAAQSLLCLYNMSGHELRVKIGAGLDDAQLARLGIARDAEILLPAYGSRALGERPASAPGHRRAGPAPQQ
jgi:alpha-glucosidase